MQGDVVLARGGQKDPTDEDARGSRRKITLCPPSRVLTPRIRPRSLTLSQPPRRSGQSLLSPGPLDGGSHCPPFFSSFSRPARGASRRKSRPSPPSHRIGSGGTVPAAQHEHQSRACGPAPIRARAPHPTSPGPSVCACVQVKLRGRGRERGLEEIGILTGARALT